MIAYGGIDHYQARKSNLVLKIEIRFHKIVIKITRLRDWTTSSAKGNNS